MKKIFILTAIAFTFTNCSKKEKLSDLYPKKYRSENFLFLGSTYKDFHLERWGGTFFSLMALHLE